MGALEDLEHEAASFEIKAITKELIKPWFRIKSCVVIMYHTGSVRTPYAKMQKHKNDLRKNVYFLLISH